MLPWDHSVSHWSFETGAYYGSKAGLELPVLLLQGLDYRCMSHLPVFLL